jgi:phage terminase Nu1 subunit (DNA packaging protein)
MRRKVMEQTPQYINEKRAAKVTDLSVQTLRNDRHRGVGIPYYKRGRRVMYRLDEVVSYMEARKVQTEN